MNAVRYVYQHRPTARFVELYTIPGDFDQTLYMRFVPNIRPEMLYASEGAMHSHLLQALDDNGDLYGYHNFLEFEVRPIKLAMSFLT